MANAAGLIKESIWRDKHWRSLSRGAQATYMQLVSQKDIDRAGIQPMQVSKWAKGCDHVTDEDIESDLDELERERFVFRDEDSDELFVRSYMRHCDITRYPNILKNALRCAGLVASEKLRRELAAELRRLRKAESSRVADLIDPDPPNGSETKSNPSETVPERLNGSGTLTEPQGYGTGTGSVTLVSGKGGGGPSETRHDETVGIRTSSQPPPRTCPDHPNGTADPCLPCKAARQRADRWQLTRDTAAAEARTAAVRAAADERHESAAVRAEAIVYCGLCDDDGYRSGIVCDHVDRADIAAAGIAKVRAAIKGGTS